VTTDELLAQLNARGVALYLEGDLLRYRAPEGALTGELRGAIANNRITVINRLRTTMMSSELAPSQRCMICDQRNWLDEPSKDGSIRTICRICGRFIGFRPVRIGAIEHQT
jgi:TubC N-terminal docking domain